MNTWKNKRKISELCKQKEHEFIHGLNNLFDIVHVNTMKIIKINENKELLTLQGHGFPSNMLDLDLKLYTLERKKGTWAQQIIFKFPLYVKSG